MNNPFRPGHGLIPLVLGGRDSQLAEFRRSLKEAEKLPRNHVLYGLRGVGKTVLLKRFESIARDNDWLVARREFNEGYNDSQRFADAITTDIKSNVLAVSLLRNMADKGKNLLKQVVSGSTLTYEDFSYQYFFSKKRTDLIDYFKTLFREYGKIIQRSPKKGLVLLFDEFQTIQPKNQAGEFPLSDFLAALGEIQAEGYPYYLVLSGLPNLPFNLKQVKTYVERMFSQMRIENLSDPDSVTLIRKTVQKGGMNFADSLIDELVQDSGGYPYFIQRFGFYLISMIDKKDFNREDYKILKKPLLEKLDVDFFEDRYERANANEKTVLRAMALTVNEPATFSSISDVVKDKSGMKNPGMHLKRLMEKGLIYQPRRGQYSFTVPLFNEFLKRISP